MNDLERLVAIEDLRRLQSRYVRHADRKEWRALAGLYLPEAKFISHGVAGQSLVTMRGREEIKHRVSSSVGAGTALHHLFSYEIDIDSPTRARGIWAMEDWIDRSTLDALPDVPAGTVRPFKAMHGCGYYDAAYEKVARTWFIAELKLFRSKLDFTY